MQVSIIVPAYNSRKTIAHTLRSLQAQTVATWEAIVVDDGSSDDTALVVQEFIYSDSRISLVQQLNQGVSLARNAGIKAAQFDWLLFIDSDDWVSPDYLKHMAQALQLDPSLDVIHCGGSRITETGITIHHQYAPDLSDLFPVLANGCCLMIHACVVRKEIVQSLGGFDPSFRTSEDWDLWQRIARTGARFGAVKEQLAFYRQRPQSLSRDIDHVFSDTLRVVIQGHEFDPRVANPRADYLQGWPENNLASIRLNYLSWFAGLYISQRESPMSLLKYAANDRDPDLSSERVAETLYQSVIVFSCQLPEVWLQLWPSVEDTIRQFFTGLETQSQSIGLAQGAYEHLKRMVVNQETSP